jgi:hypothetical protein
VVSHSNYSIVQVAVGVASVVVVDPRAAADHHSGAAAKYIGPVPLHFH